MFINKSAVLKLFLIFGATVTSLASAQVPDNGVCPVLIPEDPPSGPDVRVQSENDRDSRIINGYLVSEELRPYMAYISTPDGNGRYTNCTATLVSSFWLITAAQCDTNEKTTVRIGYPRLEDNSQSYFSISVKEDHPNYDERNNYFDIAAVRLDAEAPKNARFMKVNTAPSLPKEGSPARAVGYGTNSASRDTPEPPHAKGYLRQVDIPISTEKECIGTYDNVDYNLQFCAGYYETGGCDTCAGDGGGPLIQYVNGEPVLVGITSFGKGCAQAKAPGVYMRTSPAIDWLDTRGVVYKKSPSGDDDRGKPGLSTGAIIGIVAGVGGAALIAIIAVIVWYVYCRGGQSDEPSWEFDEVAK